MTPDHRRERGGPDAKGMERLLRLFYTARAGRSRSGCLDPEALVEAAGGDTAAPGREEHLRECARCRRYVALVREHHAWLTEPLPGASRLPAPAAGTCRWGTASDRPPVMVVGRTSSPAEPTPFQQAFIVLSVLVLLGGIVFPVVATARDNARRARCGGNLRETGAAIRMYASDYDGVLPPPRNTMPRMSWAGLLVPYLKSQRSFRCPSMAPVTILGKSVWDPPAAIGNTSWWPGYGWNVDYLAPGTMPNCSDYNRELSGSGKPVRLAAVNDPAGTVMVAGVAYAPGPGSQAGRSPFSPAGGGWHLIHAPASRGSREVCGPSDGGWGAGSYLGPFGGFEAPRHGGRGMVLFVDGHVRSMTPEQLAAGTNWTPTTWNKSVVITDRSQYLWDLQ